MKIDDERRLTRQERRAQERKLQKDAVGTPHTNSTEGPISIVLHGIDLSVSGVSLGQNLVVDMTMIEPGGRRVQRKEQAQQCPRDSLVRIGQLEVVNKTDVTPLIIHSGIQKVLRETRVVSSPARTRLYLVTDRLPSSRGVGYVDDAGWTFISPDLQRIVCVVSIPGTMESVKRDRRELGDFGRTDPRRLLASLVYRLSEHTAHELFHAGRHFSQGEQVVLANADQFEAEAAQYSKDYSQKVQSKAIPPLIVPQRLS